jgi:hypothetical protein
MLFYPWFTSVFTEMDESIRIIVEIKKFERIVPSEECKLFCEGMNHFVKLYLEQNDIKALINEFRDLKIFNIAHIPGISASSTVYNNVINLEVWRRSYLADIEILSNTFSSTTFNLADYWRDMNQYEFFSLWIRFYITRIVFQIILRKFIPDRDFSISPVISPVDFTSLKTPIYHHYAFCANQNERIYSFGWNGIFEVFYESLKRDRDENSKFYINYLIEQMLLLTDRFKQNLKLFYPVYPTVGMARSTNLPPNYILVSEIQSDARLVK